MGWATVGQQDVRASGQSGNPFFWVSEKEGRFPSTSLQPGCRGCRIPGKECVTLTMWEECRRRGRPPIKWVRECVATLLSQGVWQPEVCHSSEIGTPEESVYRLLDRPYVEGLAISSQ